MDKNKKPCFYDNIYIHPDHLDAWASEFYDKDKAMDSLIEEMAELTKAICKLKRAERSINATQDNVARLNMREETAHVLISLAGLAKYYDCTLKPEEVQKEIQNKWPEAYRTGDKCCANCYWSYLVGSLDAKLLCSAKDNSKVNNGYCCKGFAPKEDRDE